MRLCSIETPGQRTDVAFVIDSLVDAILDAVEPSRLEVAARLNLSGPDARPIIVARLNAAQWELSLETWARVAGSLARRSLNRPLNLPSLGPVMDTLLAGGNEAIRRAAVFNTRGSH